MARFAKGRRAWGECARSGKRLLRRKMVEDGYVPGLLVAPDWYEGEHPQDHPVKVTDPIAIRRPAPQRDKMANVCECHAHVDDVQLEEKPHLVASIGIGPYAVEIVEAPPAPRPIADFRGVQAQFNEGWDPVVLDWAELTGINPTFIRDSFLKPNLEVSPGVWDFSPMDPALAKMQSKNQRFALILFYGGLPWDGDVAGFANFAVASARHVTTNYPGLITCIEVWNEPDGSWPVSPADYITMFTAIRNALNAEPALANIPLAGPALYGPTDLTYWNDVISRGFLALTDIVSVHAYGSDPEFLLDSLPLFRQAMAADPKPIWISEWGAYTSAASHAESARALTVMKSLDILGADYFPLRDYPPFPDHGLLTDTGVAKAQTAAWIEWHDTIGDSAVYIGRDELNAVSYSFIFNKGGVLTRHMWATHDTDILIDGAPATLTKMPIYLTGSHTVEIDPAGDKLILDFSNDFTTEGQNIPLRFLNRSNDDTTEIDMSPSPPDFWYGLDGSWNRSFTGQQPAVGYKSVIRWVVPAGVPRIKLFGAVQRAQGGGDGTNVRILKNSTVIFSKLPLQAFDGAVFFTIVVDVSEGDKIELEAGSGGASNAFDEVFWDGTLIYQTNDELTPVEGAIDQSPAPDPTSGFKLRGVQAQFDEGWDPVVLEWADTANIDPTFIRFNFLKPNLQTGPNSWDFSPLIPALNKMRRKSQQFAAVVFYGALAWDGDFAGMAAFSLAAAQWMEQNYPGTLAHIEIWNEGDGTWPISAVDYVHLAQVIHDAIRSDATLNHIKLAGPTVYGGSDLPYINDVISGGVLNYIDLWSFHHYAEPELLPSYYNIIQFLMNQHSAVKPIYISEWGAFVDGDEGAIRQLTITKSLGIGIASYYPLKPSLINEAVSTLVGQAWTEWHNRIGDSAVYVSKDPLNSVAYSYKFTKGSQSVRHLWATTDTPVLIDGVPHTLTKAAPIYVDNATTVVLNPAGDILHAAFRQDFITTAQGTPWTYAWRYSDDSGQGLMTSPDITEWISPVSFSCLINYTGQLQPGPGVKAVLRWTVPSNMSLRVQGYASSTGLCDFRVKHNATVKFSHLAFHSLNPVESFSLTFTAAANDVIEFEVGHISGGAINLIETLIYEVHQVTARPILFFFSGQSNAYGIGTATDGSDLPAHLVDTQPPYVNNEIRIYKAPVQGGPGFFTLHNAKNNNTAATATSSNWGGEAECSWKLWNDPAYTRPIYIAKEAQSATTIAQWINGMMQSAISQNFGPALAAVQSATVNSQFWFIWHHGNADAGSLTYDQDLIQLIDGIVRPSLGLTAAQLPVIVIRASDLWINPTIYQIGHLQVLQAKACLAMSNVHLIKNDYPLLDNIHETAASHVAEGAAYKTVIDGTAVFTPPSAGSNESYSVPINTGNGTTFATLTASALGSPEGRWELTGTNAGYFRIQPLTGGLEIFAQASLTQTTYNLTATLHNGLTPSGKSVQINVTAPVVRTPVISLDPNDSINYTLVTGRYSQMKNQVNATQTWDQSNASFRPPQAALANGKKIWDINGDGVLGGPVPTTWWTLNSSTDATLMIWCSPDTITSGQALIWGIERTTNQIGWGFTYNYTNQRWGLQYTLAANNTNGPQFETGTSPRNVHYILTLVKTGTSCTLYKNGAAIVTIDNINSGMRSSILISGEGGYGMHLGGTGPVSPEFVGLVGPAYAWTVALTDSDRQTKEAALAAWAGD